MCEQSRGERSESDGVRAGEDAFEAIRSSLLVHSETNAHPLEQQSHAQHRIHATVQTQRKSIVSALFGSGDQALVKRAMKMGLCCVSPVVFADAGSQPVVVAGFCRDRLCPTCMRRRAMRVREKLISLVSAMNSPRFLTLTERDTTESLSVRMKRLTAAVRRLRRTKAWRRHVSGGVMVWETTRNEAAGTWHPHVHLLVDGAFWNHSDLLAEWKLALGGDGSARIEACPDRVKAARYLAKYLAKDSEVGGWRASTIVDFASGMHRRRLIATFGKSHSVNIDLCDAEPAKQSLPRESMSYHAICGAANQGNTTALAAAALLSRLGVTFRALFVEFESDAVSVDVGSSAAAFAALAAWMRAVETASRIVEPPTPGVESERERRSRVSRENKRAVLHLPRTDGGFLR